MWDSCAPMSTDRKKSDQFLEGMVFRYFAVICLFASVSLAQMNISGQINTDGIWDMSGLVVRVEGSGPDEMSISAPVSYGGQFTLRGLRPGLHILHVTDGNGNELAATAMTVGNVGAPVTIDLPRSDSRVRPTGASVSVYQLRHNPPKKAKKAVEKALKFSAEKRFDQAIAELQKAISIDPEFTVAYNNLGVQYMRMGNSQKAAEAFRKSVNLDPANAMSLANLAVATARIGQMSDAEQMARRAIQVNDNIPLAHYILGCLLAGRGELAEAKKHLKEAATQMPDAQKALAYVNSRTAKREAAKAETATDGLQTPEATKPTVAIGTVN